MLCSSSSPGTFHLADEASAKDPGPLPRLEGLFQHIQQQLPWRSQKLSRLSITMKFIKYYTSYYMLYEYLCFPGVNCPFLFEHSICLFLSFYPNISPLRSRVARWRCRVLVLLAKAFS